MSHTLTVRPDGGDVFLTCSCGDFERGYLGPTPLYNVQADGAEHMREVARAEIPTRRSALSALLRQEAEASVRLDKGDVQTFVVDDVPRAEDPS